jgi:CRISPR/Cas system-associated exonuclease Cas4 (RecB family)
MELQWYEDTEYRDVVLEKLYKKFASGNRGGYHVSDLVYSLRKAWYRRQPEYKQDLTKDTILYFVRGRSLGDVLEKIFDKQELEVKHDGVVGHIDAVDEERGVVIEIKTAKSIYKDTPSIHYVTQLRYYMAMYGTKIGYLMYYVITTNQLRIFKYFATDQQLADTLKEISFKRKLLAKALELNDISILPQAENKWECNYCEFEQCEYNRAEEERQRKARRNGE